MDCLAFGVGSGLKTITKFTKICVLRVQYYRSVNDRVEARRGVTCLQRKGIFEL